MGKECAKCNQSKNHLVPLYLLQVLISFAVILVQHRGRLTTYFM